MAFPLLLNAVGETLGKHCIPYRGLLNMQETVIAAGSVNTVVQRSL